MSKLTGLALMVLVSFNITAEPNENHPVDNAARSQETTEQPDQTEPQKATKQPGQQKPREKFKPTKKISEDFSAPYPIDI